MDQVADTTTLSNWALNNNTTFNARKSMSTAISRSSESVVGSLSLNGELIPCYDSVKHLGVMSKLSWSSDIDSLVNKTACQDIPNQVDGVSSASAM